jgi:ribosome-binding factor A
MAKKTQRGGAKASSKRDLGPSQRQLRAAEVVRRALVDILGRGELRDPELVGVSITLGEVRASPDLKHMNAFVAPLGPGDAKRLAAALNRSASFLRGRLGKEIELRFTPELNFIADVSFDEANYIDALLDSPEVARDLARDKDPS